MTEENGILKFKAYASTNRVGSGVEAEVEIEKEDWVSMSPGERFELVMEYLSDSLEIYWDEEAESL